MSKFWRSNVQHSDYINSTVLYTWTLLREWILYVTIVKKNVTGNDFGGMEVLTDLVKSVNTSSESSKVIPFLTVYVYQIMLYTLTLHMFYVQ